MFNNTTALAIPEGDVVKIECGGVVLWEKITSRVPSEYQEVEYISKHLNNSYIDLGFAFDTACTFYINATTKSQYNYLFGAAENSGKLRCMISQGATFNLFGSNGSSYIQIADGNISSDNEEMNVKCELRKGVLKATNLVTGYTKTITQQSEYTMTNNLYLFAQNYNGTARYANTSVAVKSFSYYDKNGEMICELVPCYRKSDDVAGMYDTVRKIFLVDASGKYFQKGADV